MSRTHCRLRTERRLWGLKQKELAVLLGHRSATHVSRIERQERSPTLEFALACEILFGISLSDIFPDAHERTEDKLMRRVYALHQRLLKDQTASAALKKELLASCLKRAVLNHKKRKTV